MEQPFFEEQLKKGEYLPVGWPWRLFVLSLIVFSFSVFIYLGMVFGYRTYLNARIADLDSEIVNLNQSIDENQLEQLILFYSQFVNIGSLLSGHKNISPILSFIEKNTYPEVNYNNLAFNSSEREIKIEGRTPLYDTLVKELKLFEQAPEIESAFLENSKLNEEKKGISEIRFNIKLIVRPEIFKL